MTDVVERLDEALPGRVESNPDRLAEYTTDRSGHRGDGLPLACVRARSIEDVQTVCRIATEAGCPIVTRGAGSGLAGGAVAGAGEIVLLLDEMNRVLEVSAENRLAVVEPGILNGKLNLLLAERGLWWPPDPASKDFSTVGGNIAMNAGGLLCAKYGVTREAVLALKVVLADGTLMSLGHRTVKGVTGYDLCALMIGSEGTLGIIVECTVKLQALRADDAVTIGAFFDTVDSAATAVSNVVRQGLVPSMMELMDGRTLAAIESHSGQRPEGPGDAYLLVQCDGADAEIVAGAIADIARNGRGLVEITRDPVESARLVAVRRNAFPALESLGTLLVEDIAVPRDRLADAFAAIRRIEQKYGVTIPTTAHAGDGNLHPTFVYTEDEVPAHIWEAAGEVFSLALELGGTLTGEHGVGVLKRAWLKDELGEEQYELSKRLKRVFDPQGLLNPGKVFPAD
ncbi:FAD-binding oxidoreductase [Citricoccus sp. GCM10030269]|uniref:FAD-binding oxidoreductase n=1 Tax=Citricoccus sp. GCM10030269 TaxID=3273388 RepID=UPI00360DA563